MIKETKRLGVWMDHANAYLIALSNNDVEHKTIASKFTHTEKEESLAKSESLMHNKEQHQQWEYYKELAGNIRNYDEVLLFGPTDAKTELLNILKADHRFEKIKIETKDADKMHDHEQDAFVKDYFSKHSY